MKITVECLETLKMNILRQINIFLNAAKNREIDLTLDFLRTHARDFDFNLLATLFLSPDSRKSFLSSLEPHEEEFCLAFDDLQGSCEDATERFISIIRQYSLKTVECFFAALERDESSGSFVF